MARRLLRWSLRATAALLGLLVVAVVGGYLTARSEWGRTQIRHGIEKVLASLLETEVTIGGLEGNLLDRIVLTDVRIEDRAGREAIRIGRIEASYTLLPLFQHTVRVRSVVVSDLVAHGRRDAAGKLNLAELLPEPSEGDAPSPWRLVIEDARIETGSLFLEDRLRVEGVALRVAVEVNGERVRVSLAPSQAHLVEEDFDVKVSGAVSLDGTEVKLVGVVLQAGASRVAVPSLVSAVDGSRISGVLAVDVKLRDLRRFVPDTPWRTDVLAAGTVERRSAVEPVRADLAGTLAGAAFWLRASVAADGRSVEAAFSAAGIDPATLVTGAPRGRVHLEGRADLAGRTLADLSGKISITGRGELAGQRIDDLAATAALGCVPESRTEPDRARSPERKARARSWLAANDERATQRSEPAAGQATGGIQGHTLCAGELTGTLAVRAPVAGGRASADLVIRGPLDKLSVTGNLEGHGLRIQKKLAPARVTAAVDVRGLPDHPEGSVRFTAASGKLAANGRLDLGPGGAIRVELAAKDVRLEALAPLLPRGFLPTGLRGSASARVVATRDSRRIEALTATLAAREVAWGTGVNTLTIDAAATLRGRVLEARARANGPLTGKIAVEADLRVPADLLDARAWKRLDERSVLRAHVELGGIDLERVAGLAGLTRPLAGWLRATIDAGPGLATVEARVNGEGIESGYIDRPLAVRSHLALARGRMTVLAEVARDGGGRLMIEARIAAPARLALLTASHIESATVAVEEVEPAWIEPLRLRLSGLRGKFSVTATKGPAGIEADVRMIGARVEGLAAPVNGHVHATFGREEVVATLETTLAGRPLLVGEVSLGAGLDAIAALDEGTLLRAPIAADLRIEHFPLDVAGSALGAGLAMSGALDLAAKITGSAAHPAASVRLSASDARSGGIAFARFEATARLAEDAVHASLTAAQLGGGSLAVDVELDPRDVRSGAARIQATAFDLGFLAAFGPPDLHVEKGLLAADLTLNRTSRRGWLKLTAAELRATELLETFRDASVDLKVEEDGGFEVAVKSGVGFKGHVELTGAGRLVGLDLREANGTFRTSSLSVLTGRSRVGVDARGRFTGAPGNGYGLEIVLDQSSLSLPKDVGGSLHSTAPLEDVVFMDARAREERRAQKVRPEGPLLRVHLVTPSSMLVRSAEVRAYLSLDLEVALHPSFTAIRGPVRIERGYIELFSRRWSFQTSRVLFDGAVPPNPALDITLSHDFRATSVAILLAGTAQRPEIVLSSAGAYDRSQLLGFVLGGSPDDSGPASERDLSEQALSSAGGLLFGQIQPLLRKIVPVDVLSVKQKGGTTQLDTITVGKWLSKDIYIAYGHRFADQSADAETQNSNEGTLEWYLARGMRLDLIAGDRGEGSADVLWIPPLVSRLLRAGAAFAGSTRSWVDRK